MRSPVGGVLRVDGPDHRPGGPDYAGSMLVLANAAAGRADILWRHAGDGDVHLWGMDATALVLEHDFGLVTADWTVLR